MCSCSSLMWLVVCPSAFQMGQEVKIECRRNLTAFPLAFTASLPPRPVAAVGGDHAPPSPAAVPAAVAAPGAAPPTSPPAPGAEAQTAVASDDDFWGPGQKLFALIQFSAPLPCCVPPDVDPGLVVCVCCRTHLSRERTGTELCLRCGRIHLLWLDDRER
jgi:hypothetical protein